MLNIKILTNSDEELICKYLYEIDDIFPVPMSSRVNIESHAKKVLLKGVVIVAEDDGKLVGICLGYANDAFLGRAYMGTLGISEGYRSCGIGSKLIDAFIDYAREKNMTYLGVHAHQDNIRGIKFYQRNGFILTEDKEKPYAESVYLTKRL